jgi:hypothetical protein
MARKAVMRSLKEYLLELAKDVAYRGIKIAVGDVKDMSLDPTDMYKLPLHLEGDGRLKNKVYTMLQEAGALVGFNYTTTCQYHYPNNKVTKHWWGIVDKAWFEKESKNLWVIPTFSTSGFKKTKEYSYSSEELKAIREEDNYRDLLGYNSFSDAEFIWIYHHLKEYDLKHETESQKTRYGNTLRDHYMIYPRALLSDLSIGVFHGHVTDYLNKNTQWTLKNVLGIEDDGVIDIIKLSDLKDPEFIIDDLSKIDDEFVIEQLERIDSFKTMLDLGAKSYTRLQEAVAMQGGWNRVMHLAREKFLTYLYENFPLHMCDDEKDKDLKKLCMWVMESKHKGFNEANQKVA